MINWRDRGIIIDYRRHGESAAIVEVLTENHGRHIGIVRGGGARKNTPNLQEGIVVIAEFSARLEEHLGTFRLDVDSNHVAGLMIDSLRLRSFASICALTKFGMVERDPHPALFRATLDWLQSDLPRDSSIMAYVTWELILLREAGFELELDRCAVTGGTDDLAYVSPKTGRAVSRGAAGEWADKLLPYSPMFVGEPSGANEALQVTGYFLTHWLAQMINKHELPRARARLVDAIASI